MEIQINGIVKRFGEKTAVDNVSFTARGGKAFGLLGRNGAGKTTTMRMIMDVFKADEGTITIDNQKIDRKKIRFGYLPEERGLYPKKKIKDQLIYLAELNDMSKSEALESINHWLDKLDMKQHLEKKLDTLSKGNQQKIQLASVLMINPDIIILDEPFSGLDPVNASVLQQIVFEQIEEGKIVIFSSHQMNNIEEVCDDIIILDEGKAALAGNLNQIKDSYPKTHIKITGNGTENIKKDVEKHLSAFVKSTKISELELDIYLYTEKGRDEILDIISKGSYDIDSFRVVKPSLNEIFIQTTKGAEQ
ncbi:MAG: ATP-binding cassette domain-containing protein [Clostridia bacterium]|nr:ATP-binding cassette domain-containing protein [Clostridia bacterium]